jgi:hypothetical protein
LKKNLKLVTILSTVCSHPIYFTANNTVFFGEI